MVLSAILGLALTAAPAGSGPATAVGYPVQPGDEIITPVGGCTLNFVYDGTGKQAGKVFVGTAAHCVNKVGDPIKLGATGETFGKAAFVGNQDNTADDYAFIQVLTAFVPRVNPAVKGSPAYPKGVTTPTETATGDLVQLSGYGLGFGATQPTQERREAVLGYDDTSIYDVSGPIDWGDSGGPLVHIATGKALGIVSRLCLGVCTEEGPTVQGIIARARARNFPVSLRTV
ncbi:MAG: Trypsin-like peptidase domain [Actinomycetota bacterium]|jgi:hypothetical protein|nr:Trypsin-like peptidase domain [Actinomycetota bacterium]